MPKPSPLHPRLKERCLSYQWKYWAGFLAPCHYGESVQPEYFALRESSGLIDVSPLFKYEVRGPDACRLLDRMTVRQVASLKPGKVSYTCWCDDRGFVIDDGTLSCLEEDRYFLTAARPVLHWLLQLARGFRVEVRDLSDRLAALALQGPTSAQVVKSLLGSESSNLRYFEIRAFSLQGARGWISRTGYTGDLGFEFFVEAEGALELWDALWDSGRPWGLLATGLDALDMTRIEAGFILSGVDYFSCWDEVRESRCSYPEEIGLGRLVDLEKGSFVGRSALQERRMRRALFSFSVPWSAFENLYRPYDQAPALPFGASREPLPLYQEGEQVGQLTSHVWSPILKCWVGIGSVSPDLKSGDRLAVEHTVDFVRERIEGELSGRPLFDPPRRRA